jgi:hypothetical protein
MPGYFHRLAANARPAGPHIRPVRSYVHASLTTLEDVAAVPENDVLKASAVGVRVNVPDEVVPAVARQSRPAVADPVSGTSTDDTSGSSQMVSRTVRATHVHAQRWSASDGTPRPTFEDSTAKGAPDRITAPPSQEHFIAPAVRGPVTSQPPQTQNPAPAPHTRAILIEPRIEARPGRSVQPDSDRPGVRALRTPVRQELPDVRIHIGRIELTAVTPPAAPRRRPQASRSAMPLDEYLRRRDGKAR